MTERLRTALVVDIFAFALAIWGQRGGSCLCRWAVFPRPLARFCFFLAGASSLLASVPPAS